MDVPCQRVHQCRPLDWREFSASLYVQEQSGTADYFHNQDKTPPAQPKPLPDKWAHPISAPESGCLLVATKKLDGVHTLDRTVVFLLQLGTENPPGRSLWDRHKPASPQEDENLNPNNIELGTTFADCSLHFGGPLGASMFLMRADEGIGPHGFEEVLPGLYFGTRNSMDEASALVKKGALEPRYFKIFVADGPARSGNRV